MKKLAISFLLGIMVFAAANVQARNVSEQEARQAAANYFSRNSGQKVNPTDLTLMHQIDNMELGVAECYMFNVANGGWIIMAATTCIDPVVAYSEENALPEDYTALAPGMRMWVAEYCEMIGEIQEADANGQAVEDDYWKTMFSTEYANSPKTTNINLVSSQWDQGQPHRPSYNYYCPRTDDGYCYTGCVATAMAQLIRYWGCPVQPIGVKSYMWGNERISMRFDTIRFDYSQMPNKIINDNGTLMSTITAEQLHQVALLNYAAGVSVNMDYDAVDGSGTQSRFVVSAMHDYFRYTYGTQVSRGTNGVDTSFIGKMRRNLIHSCPVYMSGKSSTDINDPHAAGHAWLCTGYRIDTVYPSEENRYYMNWGWGSTGGNGYFNLVNNNMNTGSYNFNVNQAAIFGVYPQSPDSTSIEFLGIPEVEDNTEIYDAYPNPATVSVSLPYSITSPAEMVVYTIDGKTIARRKLQPGTGSVKINVCEMPSGIYIYRIGGKSGKFMVQ